MEYREGNREWSAEREIGRGVQRGEKGGECREGNREGSADRGIGSADRGIGSGVQRGV